ncbi:fluoride efflux transporter CrcB [soil metagenome]
MKNDTPFRATFPAWVPDSVWVALGGILGTLSRHGTDVLLLPSQLAHPGFPWPTFLINVSGAALLGFVMAWIEESARPPNWLRPFAAIGFCGSFTTFSTASVEILLLARDGHPAIALTYLAASLVCGILAVTITTALGVRIFKGPGAAKGKLTA